MSSCSGLRSRRKQFRRLHHQVVFGSWRDVVLLATTKLLPSQNYGLICNDRSLQVAEGTIRRMPAQLRREGTRIADDIMNDATRWVPIVHVLTNLCKLLHCIAGFGDCW